MWVPLFVEFCLASSGQSKFLWEWASLMNRMVRLWVCPAPPFWPNFRPTGYIKHISGFSCHTPAVDAIKNYVRGWISCTSWMSFVWFTWSLCSSTHNILNGLRKLGWKGGPGNSTMLFLKDAALPFLNEFFTYHSEAHRTSTNNATNILHCLDNTKMYSKPSMPFHHTATQWNSWASCVQHHLHILQCHANSAGLLTPHNQQPFTHWQLLLQLDCALGP